ncbi:hypothetical protein T439DRAFT_335448 [Meredithblackwellia eburnea MCA 4105]
MSSSLYAAYDYFTYCCSISSSLYVQCYNGTDSTQHREALDIVIVVDDANNDCCPLSNIQQCLIYLGMLFGYCGYERWFMTAASHKSFSTKGGPNHILLRYLSIQLDTTIKIFKFVFYYHQDLGVPQSMIITIVMPVFMLGLFPDFGCPDMVNLMFGRVAALSWSPPALPILTSFILINCPFFSMDPFSALLKFLDMTVLLDFMYQRGAWLMDIVIVGGGDNDHALPGVLQCLTILGMSFGYPGYECWFMTQPY